MEEFCDPVQKCCKQYLNNTCTSVSKCSQKLI